MDKLNLDDYIRKVPDFPKKGVLFYDITSILTSPSAFNYCIDSMVEIYKDKKIEMIAAIEARGFLFAAPFSYRMGIPLILVRKKGKLPGKTLYKEVELEYGRSEIEIHLEDVKKDSRILLVDDLIATGGTLSVARELLGQAGGVIQDIFGVVGLPILDYKKKLSGITINTLIEYDSE
jgi:adenine phosphoribosyltransferase